MPQAHLTITTGFRDLVPAPDAKKLASSRTAKSLRPGAREAGPAISVMLSMANESQIGRRTASGWSKCPIVTARIICNNTISRPTPKAGDGAGGTVPM